MKKKKKTDQLPRIFSYIIMIMANMQYSLKGLNSSFIMLNQIYHEKKIITKFKVYNVWQHIHYDKKWLN